MKSTIPLQSKNKLRILYAIQGTGNGHISRGIEILNHLLKKPGITVDVLISGNQYELELPFPVKYKLKGLGFVFGKKGGVDLLHTYRQLDIIQLRREIRQLPVDKYDLILNDFEPVSAWAAFFSGKPCIGLSNQAATLHPLAPKPKYTDPIGKLILKHYAPVSANYGFHFKKFDDHIFTPVIRSEIRNLEISNNGHITVYLPSYKNKKIIEALQNMKDARFEVFSKHAKKTELHENIFIRPLHKDQFLQSIGSAAGVICNAGFGTASEALFLGKKLLVIPMKNQYEQHCNAEVLRSMGVTVAKSLKKKQYDRIQDWIHNGKVIHVNYPDQTDSLLQTILEEFSQNTTPRNSQADTEFINMVNAMFPTDNLQ